MKSANTSVSSIAALNDATLGLFHLKTMLTAGLGFFSAAYDLFIIGYALALIRQEWHPDALMMGLIGSVSLLAVLFGAYLFGRIADIYGRRKIYGIEALLMVLGALGSACANDITTLIIFRFILGLGVGGDYPLSSVIMSEYANRDNRGLLVGLTFSFQAARSKMKCNTSGRRQTEVRDGQKVQTIDARSAKPDTAWIESGDEYSWHCQAVGPKP